VSIVVVYMSHDPMKSPDSHPLICLVAAVPAGERRLEALARSVRSGGNSVRSYWATLMGLSDYKEAYLQWMDEHDLDAFLCPGLRKPHTIDSPKTERPPD
jgi:hypothetical protein